MDTQLHPVSAEAKDEHTTILKNDVNFEEVYIKEELGEEIPEDREFYENELRNIKKEECVSDNEEQIDEEHDNSIIVNNDIRKTKKTNSKSFCCKVCNKNYAWIGSLKRHMKTHSGINESKLQLDLKSHNEDKEFECRICRKLFGRKKNLRNHVARHAGIKKFQCPTCKKLFTQNVHLKAHVKIHSGIKDYKCTLCNKQFRYSSNLDRHMKIHNGIKDYACSVCKKMFVQSFDLKRHMNIHK